MILCVGTTPAWQRVMVFPRLIRGAVNRARFTLDGPAGKSVNVAKVLQILGEYPVATGFLGGDRGAAMRSWLTGRGMELDFVTVAAGTRQCLTVIEEEGAAPTELVEEARPVDVAEVERLRAVLRRRIPGSQATVMSGTLAPGVEGGFYRECVGLVTTTGGLSVVDARGEPLLASLEARPGLVKPNLTELAATVGRDLNDERTVLAAMRELVEHGAERIVVTAGTQPSLAFDGRTCWRISPPRIAAVNPIGSGDAFTAVVVARLLQGDDLGEACRWGAAAGAANALTLMPGELRREDVDRLVGEAQAERL